MKKTAILAGTVITALALVGCGKSEEELTLGQRADTNIAQAEQSMRDMGQEARQRMERAGDAIGDAAISAQVNAALAKDPQLSALDIDVDTTAGRVKLSGTAPTPEARDRATQLAASVSGVQSVDNLLQVETRQQ